MKKYFRYLAILSLGVVGCEPEFDNPIDEGGHYTSGEADFSNYVALGNSLTAGYADNALYIIGQQNSYPNILAQQFSLAGGGEFNQPLMADNAGGLLLNGNQITNNRLVLAVDENGNPAPAVYTGAEATTEITNTLSGPFNNMGVPGAKVYHLGAAGYGNVQGVESGAANPYFARFASSSDVSVMEDALSQNPTFFSLWIGNNDVLGFATSGGTGVDQTGNLDPTTYGSNDITDPNVFAQVYSEMVTQLTAQGADGVLINIPDVTSTAYFTTVPHAPLDPTDPNFGPQIPMLNETYGLLNQALNVLGYADRTIQFSNTAASAVVVRDEELTDISEQIAQVLVAGGLDAATAGLFGQQFGQARQATQADLMILTSSGIIGQVNTQRRDDLVAMGVDAEMATQLSINGVTYPLGDQWVLTPDEQQMIESARLAYNATIEALADANNLAFVDASGMLTNVSNAGIPFDGGTVTSEFATGGAFSLDGIHLTPRGYALVANEVIRAVNNTYEANVPQVNVGNYNAMHISNDVN